MLGVARDIRRNRVLALAAGLLILLFASAMASDRSEAGRRADSLAAVFQAGAGRPVTLDSNSTLDDYLTVAMQRSPALRGAFNGWVAALRQSDAAGALPNPMFSYGEFIEEVQTRVGPQERKFGLRQAFPWFGTLGAKQNVAFHGAQAAYQKFEAERLKVFYQVKAAYYDLYFIGQNLQITQDNLDLLKFWESVARSKYTVGLQKHPDVIKVQVELGTLADRVETLKEQIAPAVARLRALLDLPDSVSLAVPDSIEVTEESWPTDSVVALVRVLNPDLRAMQYMVDRDAAGVDLAHKLARPGFSIGVDYIQTGEAMNPATPGSGKDPWMVGASVSLPIWFGKNRARTEAAEAKQRASEYAYANSVNQLDAYTRNVLFHRADALRKVKLYRDGLVPKAEQSLNASYAAYQSGEADFLNVLDAQRKLLDFQLTVERQKVELAKRSSELEMLAGTEIHAEN